MPKLRSFAIPLCVSALMALATNVGSAAEKKAKVTYEEAWKLCQVEVNKIPADQVGQRQARGGACMKKLGHKI
jgi:hypothetical protein